MFKGKNLDVYMQNLLFWVGVKSIFYTFFYRFLFLDF